MMSSPGFWSPVAEAAYWIEKAHIRAEDGVILVLSCNSVELVRLAHEQPAASDSLILGLTTDRATARTIQAGIRGLARATVVHCDDYSASTIQAALALNAGGATSANLVLVTDPEMASAGNWEVALSFQAWLMQVVNPVIHQNGRLIVSFSPRAVSYHGLVHLARKDPEGRWTHDMTLNLAGSGVYSSLQRQFDQFHESCRNLGLLERAYVVRGQPSRFGRSEVWYSHLAAEIMKRVKDRDGPDEADRRLISLVGQAQNPSHEDGPARELFSRLNRELSAVGMERHREFLQGHLEELLPEPRTSEAKQVVERAGWIGKAGLVLELHPPPKPARSKHS